MGNALAQAGLDIDRVGPLRQRLGLFFKAKQLLYRELLHKRHMRDWEPQILAGYRTQVLKAISRLSPDVLFCPGNSLPAIADVASSIPIVAWCDATFASLVNYYPAGGPGDVHAPGFCNLSSEALSHGMEGEGTAMRKCALLVFTSTWAAESAVDCYGVDPARIRIVPFGANLPQEVSPEQASQIVTARPGDGCRLLFLGGEWGRKGGPMAVRVAAELNQRGLRTELIVAGCNPPGPLPPFVRVLGFISKAAPEGEQAIAELLATSHFLILPSRADCTPITISEAGSRALPVLARSTGGIPDVLRDQENGMLFPVEATVEDWAVRALECLSDRQAYEALATSTFQGYRQRLNWKRNGELAAGYIRQLISGRLSGDPPSPSGLAAVDDVR